MVLPAWVVEAGDFIIGCGFLLGMILMNVPQHYLCWKYRSAEGLSLAYILICTISNVTLTLASLMGDYHIIIAVATNSTTDDPSSSNSTAAFFDDNSTAAVDGRYLEQEGTDDDDNNQALAVLMLRVFATLNACMPTLQNFTSILVGVPSLIFYYFWFSKPLPHRPTLQDIPASQQPLLRETSTSTEATERTSFTTDSTTSFMSDDNDIDEDATPTSSPASSRSIEESQRFYFSDGTEYRLAKIATILTWIVVVIAVIISFFVLLDDSSLWETALLQIWGSIAAITNMVLFIPQIVTTWRNQHEGVLSLASLLVSVLGDLGIVVFWILASGETVWVYAACLADAGMQVILIFMIIDFRRKRARERAMAQGDYDFINDNSEEDYRLEYPSKQGEIEVVYGEVLDMYQSTTSALESLWDTPTVTPTTHGSVDHSSRQFLV